MKNLGLWIALCLLLSACGGSGGGQGGMVYVVYQGINTDQPERVVYYLADPQAQPVQVASASYGALVRFSPDGSKLAVVLMEELPNTSSTSLIPTIQFTLQTMSPDGQNKVTWATMQGNPIQIPQFFFIQDSSRLVYSICEDADCNKTGLYFGDLSNGSKQLVASEAVLSIQSLSPTQKVLASVFDIDKRANHFYTIDLSGAKTEIDSNLPDYPLIYHFIFAANSRVLVQARDISSGESLLLSGSADLTGWQPVLASDLEVRDYLVSPDGKKALVYLFTNDCLSNYTVQLVDLQSGQTRDIGCSFTGSLVDFSPDSSEFIWMDEKISIHRISASGEDLETLPNGVSSVRYSADGSQIAYWLRNRDTNQACITLRPRTGGAETSLEKTCISTADLAAMPNYLMWYGAWRSPDNTW